jgi:predicted MFS family arabinose efflux permease
MSRDLILLSLALAIWGVGESAFLYFQPLYLEQMGANPVQIGLILGIVGAAMILAHLPAGYAADRYGRLPLLRSAWVIASLATGIMALANSLPVFVLGSALYGLTSFVAGPMNSYVTAARGNWTVARALTVISATYNLGAIIGPLIGGWIGEHYDLRISIIMASALFVASTVIVYKLKPQPVEHSTKRPPQEAFSRILHPRYIGFLIIVFLSFFVMYLPQPLSPNFLANFRDVDLMEMGQLLSWKSVGVVVLSLTIGRINARYGFIITQAGMAIFSFLIWKGSGIPWYAMAYFLLGNYVTARYLATAQARSLIDAGDMGIAYGLLETTAVLAVVLGPPLAGLIYERNPLNMYVVSLAGIGISILVSSFLMPVKARDLV